MDADLQKQKHEKTQIIPDFFPVAQDFPEPEKKPEEEKKKKRKANSSTHLKIFKEEELKEEEINISTVLTQDLRPLLQQSGSRYVIEKLLATGGFGQIFLAKDRVLGRKTVIKTLKQEYIKDDFVVDRFIAEAKLCSQLNHPSIVSLYNLSTDNINGLHLIMQLIKGITLTAYLQRTLSSIEAHPVSMHVYNKYLRERLEIFLRICDAVSYGHDRHIIHNDIKPENIMIANFGQVYVMDWGIATMEGSQHTQRVAGTVSYMAPERISRHVSNQRTDIFSLGMLLNELVTLRGPITEEESEKIADRICSGAYEPSTCILKKYRIARPLRAIIEKARAQKPAERYSSVKKLSDDVRHYLFFEEVKACPDHLPEKIYRYLFHHPLQTVILLLLILLGFGTSVIVNWQRNHNKVLHIQQDMYSQLNKRTETDKLASEMGRRLLLLQEQVRSLSNSFSYEADHETNAPKAPVFLADHLSKCPHHIVHTAYYARPITLEHGVFYRLNPKLTAADLQKWANCFNTIHSQMLSAMFVNTNSDKHTIRNDQNKLFHLRESLIRRMIFLLNNDIAYTYPGMFDKIKTTGDFQSDFIQRESRSGQNVLWSPPFPDSSGYAVISCWQTLFNSKGLRLGSIGFEISFNEFIKPLLESIRKENDGSIYTIVTKDNKLIFSTRFYNRHKGFITKTFESEVYGEGSYYPFPKIVRKIKSSQNTSSFPELLNGEEYQIYWKQLYAVEWYLIRHVPVKNK